MTPTESKRYCGGKVPSATYSPLEFCVATGPRTTFYFGESPLRPRLTISLYTGSLAPTLSIHDARPAIAWRRRIINGYWLFHAQLLAMQGTLNPSTQHCHHSLTVCGTEIIWLTEPLGLSLLPSQIKSRSKYHLEDSRPFWFKK